MADDPKKKAGEKEIPTITSLLKRRKLRSGPDALDRSKPMDLSELEREFAPVEEHPTIEGIDHWDTRGIARQVKHNEAARKSDEFRALLEKKNVEVVEITGRNKKRGERSISVSVKIDRGGKSERSGKVERSGKIERFPDFTAKQTPAPQGQPQQRQIAAPPQPQQPAQRSSVRPVAPRTPQPAAPQAPPRAQAPRAPQPQASQVAPVQSAPQRRASTARPPQIWTMEMLKGGPDPLGKGLSILLERGAGTALFLSISPPPPGAKIPHFVAAAAAKPDREKLAIWTGLRWDPATVPQVWNQLLKSGYVEFHPPGNVTNVGSRRNTIRAAFGLGPDEILLLIRVGPVAACRGVLAIYSNRSLLMELGPILTLFNTPLPLQKAG